ncbi:MAG: YraN family protein [Thermoleophilia bacterium]
MKQNGDRQADGNNDRRLHGADERKAHGDAGEALACRHLEQQGYSILKTNYRSRYGEIDIIARRGSLIAFIEVKTRLGRSHGQPFEAVGARKQDQIRRMAQMWLAAHQRDRSLRECSFRFDVISVKMEGRDPRPGGKNFGLSAGIGPADVKNIPGIQHIQDAFR